MNSSNFRSIQCKNNHNELSEAKIRTNHFLFCLYVTYKSSHSPASQHTEHIRSPSQQHKHKTLHNELEDTNVDAETERVYYCHLVKQYTYS